MRKLRFIRLCRIVRIRILLLKFRRNLMIKHSSVYHLLTIYSLLRLLKFILTYTTGCDVMSYYQDEITDRITKYLSDVLLSYLWQIEFCYCRSKIRDLIRNLHQNHSSFCGTNNMFKITLFVFSKILHRVFWLFDRKESPGNKVVYLVTAWKLNLGR